MKQIKNLSAGIIAAALCIIAAYFLLRPGKQELPAGIIPLDLGITTVYLIKHNDGYLQFDTGYQKDYELYKELLLDYGIQANEITHLFISHHHDDHVGFINELIETNPTIKVVLSEKTAPLIQKGANNKNNGGGLVNKRVYLLFRLKQLLTPDWDLTFPPFIPHKNTIVFKNEWDFFRSEIGQNIKIIPTPGHTSDSVSLIVDDTYLLGGDMASDFLSWAGTSNLTIFNENITEVYHSWDTVISLGIKTILPSHGEPFPITDLSKNIRKYSQNELVRFF